MINSLNLMAYRTDIESSPFGNNVEQMDKQQLRMIIDKKKSLDRALRYSYQAANVLIDNNPQKFRALVNRNKIADSYIDATLSIGFEANVKVGSVFKWIDTNTYWIVYNQNLNELAYFRGECRKCDFTIKFDNKSTMAAIIGPNEKKISSLRVVSDIDIPNYTIQIIIPANEDNLKYFLRYTKFYLQDNPICWRVEALNTFREGIITLYAKEYYSNRDEDDIEKGLVGVKIEEPVDTSFVIHGENVIKPIKTYEYWCTDFSCDWEIVDFDKLPLLILARTTDKIKLKWKDSFGGEFILKHGEEQKKITVKSLFE